MSGEFSQVLHDKLTTLLALQRFPTRYKEFCRKYAVGIDVMARGPDQGRILESLRNNAVCVTSYRKFKTLAFGTEQVCGWSWTGKLVMQRYGVFEPMLEGWDINRARCVGSTWLDLATEGGARLNPPLDVMEFLPPALSYNRPRYNGDPEMIEPFVVDLVALWEEMKDAIRRSDW